MAELQPMQKLLVDQAQGAGPGEATTRSVLQKCGQLLMDDGSQEEEEEPRSSQEIFETSHDKGLKSRISSQPVLRTLDLDWQICSELEECLIFIVAVCYVFVFVLILLQNTRWGEG